LKMRDDQAQTSD